jgi:hypothetical protein
LSNHYGGERFILAKSRLPFYPVFYLPRRRAGGQFDPIMASNFENGMKKAMVYQCYRDWKGTAQDGECFKTVSKYNQAIDNTMKKDTGTIEWE